MYRLQYYLSPANLVITVVFFQTGSSPRVTIIQLPKAAVLSMPILLVLFLQITGTYFNNSVFFFNFNSFTFVSSHTTKKLIVFFSRLCITLGQQHLVTFTYEKS